VIDDVLNHQDDGDVGDDNDDGTMIIIVRHYNHINLSTHTNSSHSSSSSGDLKRSLHGHTERITCVTAKKDQISSDVTDDALIISCTISGSIRIWNYATG
jgi:hypothetical protein